MPDCYAALQRGIDGLEERADKKDMDIFEQVQGKAFAVIKFCEYLPHERGEDCVCCSLPQYSTTS